MKLLALSDQVDPVVYSTHIAERFAEVDLVVGCGDLPASYLEFVVSMLNVPLVYVPGNHDSDDYRVRGGEIVDGRMTVVRGMSIVGFGGSPRYKPQGRHQYTDAEMAMRMTPHLPRLAVRRLLRGRGCDLLVTHAPPRGIHDLQDPAHIGFQAFRRFLSLFRPSLMVHGHSHAHRNLDQTKTHLLGTCIINAYPYRLVEWSEQETRASLREGYGGSRK